MEYFVRDVKLTGKRIKESFERAKLAKLSEAQNTQM